MPSLDAEGYLVEPQDWSTTLAAEFARQENIQLSEDHGDVIHFMRDYYEAHLLRLANETRQRERELEESRRYATHISDDLIRADEQARQKAESEQKRLAQEEMNRKQQEEYAVKQKIEKDKQRLRELERLNQR